MAGEKEKKTGKKAAEAGKKNKRKTTKKAFKYPGRGAPKIYTDPAKLEKDCEKYFNSISRVETLKDGRGSPILNGLGKEVEVAVWLKKPSMGGLAEFLGISARTLRNYEDNEDMKPVLEWAKEKCKSWLMDQVTDPANKNVKGTIFVLENCYGMKEQVAVEHGGERIEEYLARLEAAAEGTTEF